MTLFSNDTLLYSALSTNRSYFLAVSTSTNMVGAASLKEKEMVATLFCKLANLMRLKIMCFGSDTQVTVKCLQVGWWCVRGCTGSVVGLLFMGARSVFCGRFVFYCWSMVAQDTFVGDDH